MIENKKSQAGENDNEEFTHEEFTHGESAHELSEAQIDDQLEGTFPASDPPSWTLGVESAEETPNLIDEENAQHH